LVETFPLLQLARMSYQAPWLGIATASRHQQAHHCTGKWVAPGIRFVL
jgi:hypothetical protein